MTIHVKDRDNAAMAGSARFSFVPHLSGADRLVALGFRHWVAGYQTSDIACWEQAWRLFEGELGKDVARRIVGDLSCWVRAITSASRREIEVFPGPCRGFCRDECVAVSLVASMQHGVCPAMQACTKALLENCDCDDVMGQSCALAATLRANGLELSPDWPMRLLDGRKTCGLRALDRPERLS